MVTISDATLRANVFETLYDSISGISSWGLSSSNTVTVTAAFIDSSTGNPPLPQIVIHPIDIENRRANYDGSLMDRDIRVTIEIYSNKAKDLDQITDKMFDTIEAASLGLMLVDTDENHAMGAPAGLKIRSKAVSLTFRRRS